MDEFKISEQHLLLPSSEKARPKLVQQLSKYNEVVKIDLYRPVPNFKNISQVKSLVRKHQIDAVTFSSSSAVEFYFKEDNVPEFDHYFAIGKQTARTILKFNTSVKVANKQTLDSLIDKIIESRNKMKFDRHRRLRSSKTMRDLVRETHVRKEDLIYPIFVVEQDDIKVKLNHYQAYTKLV